MPTNPPQKYNVVNLYPSSLRNSFKGCNMKASFSAASTYPFYASIWDDLASAGNPKSGGSAFSNSSDFLRKKGLCHDILGTSAYSAVFSSSLSNFWIQCLLFN